MCRFVKKIIGLVVIGYLCVGMVFADENREARFTEPNGCPSGNIDLCLEQWLVKKHEVKQPYWDSFVLFDWGKELKRSLDISAQRMRIFYLNMVNKDQAFCRSLQLIDYILVENPVTYPERLDSNVLSDNVISPCVDNYEFYEES